MQAEAWFDDPENIWYSIHIPRNTPIFVVVPEARCSDEAVASVERRPRHRPL